MATKKIEDGDIARFEQFTQKSVQDVFQSMASVSLTSEEPSPMGDDAEGQIIGSVDFAGEASGIICIYASLKFAKNVTSKMLGIAEAEVDSDEMVNDAIGELSNMVAGNVKSRLCDGGWPCTLTIPSIVRGQKLSVERSADIVRRVMGFKGSFSGDKITAELLLKQN